MLRISLEQRIHIIIGLRQWNRNHPNNKMTMEQYIKYREEKEERRLKNG